MTEQTIPIIAGIIFFADSSWSTKITVKSADHGKIYSGSIKGEGGAYQCADNTACNPIALVQN